jgi:ferric-dicitrate binding protein FerR (iron transport regulator)
VLVGAGRHAELRMGMQRAVVEPAELGSALGWLSGRLQAENESLGDVLKDLSRYTRAPLRADTPSIAALRVSAVLRTGDTEALRAALKGAFGLELERRGNDFVVFDPNAHAPTLR